jgi:hypothetical protein
LQEDWKTLFLHLTVLLGQTQQKWLQQVLLLLVVVVVLTLVMLTLPVLLKLLVQELQLGQQASHL